MEAQVKSKNWKGQTLTPIPRKQGKSVTMSFPDAMKEVIKGNRIRRLSWDEASDHGLLKNSWLTIYTKGKFHRWLVSEGDMEGQDFVVMKMN